MIADAAGVDLGRRQQELGAAQAVGHDAAVDVGAGIVDAERQQARVGRRERLVGQALAAVHQDQRDVALAVVQVRQVVDAAVARRDQQAGERARARSAR